MIDWLCFKWVHFVYPSTCALYHLPLNYRWNCPQPLLTEGGGALTPNYLYFSKHLNTPAFEIALLRLASLFPLGWSYRYPQSPGPTPATPCLTSTIDTCRKVAHVKYNYRLVARSYTPTKQAFLLCLATVHLAHVGHWQGWLRIFNENVFYQWGNGSHDRPPLNSSLYP